MRALYPILRLGCAVALLILWPVGSTARAQETVPTPGADLHMRLTWPHAAGHRPVPAVIWLEAQAGTVTPAFVPRDHYTLLQKNRTFMPHLQVVPVGTAVAFPNADPFFHNVFSLFDGKRFDLGLYEAGSTKSVTFSREGVSYIFCNIHPEMSAVVVALTTPLYAIAGRNDAFSLANVPAGDYRLHLWIEGVPLTYLDSLARNVHVQGGNVDLGSIAITASDPHPDEHENKFGKPYPPENKSPY